MEVRDGPLEGLRLIEPSPVGDERGWFPRVFDRDTHAAAGIDHTRLVQENHSRSRRGVLRGLHVRTELAESKLVRCAHGHVFDVVVDLRPWSSTFARWASFDLDDERHLQVLVPPGCAHGFQAQSEVADVCYRVDAVYDKSKDAALAWDDPELAIPWPIADPVLSPRDQQAPTLGELRPSLEAWFGAAAGP
jgi:dTDP-4-dehydrorhamnose 3,5-epimerase